jgi:GT2 family glycosyltransferase
LRSTELKIVDLFLSLRAAERFGRLLSRATPAKRLGAYRPGVSVIVPERASHAILGASLTSCHAAVSVLAEPAEIIVVVNGSPARSYDALREAHPGVRWKFFPQPLWYLGAVREGLRMARFDWVYLINNDMVADPATIRALLPLRRDDVFGIASQISFADPLKRRQETGWTSYTKANGCFAISDDLPPDEKVIRGTLYAGGGASLFRKQLLRELIQSCDAYFPFYWEDVEWGWRAWLMGYSSWFCPQSRVSHTHRQTNRKLFAESEIDRMMNRNRIVFQLRNGPPLPSRAAMAELLSSLDPVSRDEILDPVRRQSVARGRFRLARVGPEYREPGEVWRLVC